MCTKIALMVAAVVVCFGSQAAAQELTPMEELGKSLFFDRISQPMKHMSCATCHGSRVGWTGPVAGINLHGAVYRGSVPRRFGNRKPPSVAYATFSPIFHLDEDTGNFVGGNFWDGRATGERLGNPAADQALGPFLNPVEQNMPSMIAVCQLVEASNYADLFEEVWGPGTLDCSEAGVAVMYDRIGLSIAAYEASPEVNAFTSKFDLYWCECLEAGNDPEACGLAEGEKDVLDPAGILTDQEFDGLIEFGEYCAPCHVSHQPGPGGVPPLFTDYTFENIGVPANPENPFYYMDLVFLDDGTPINPEGDAFVDFGLGNFLLTRPEWVDLAAENDGKHKVPTVRNVDMRFGFGFPKAYMHNGVFKSLEEVVHFYNTRDVPSENWAPPEVDVNVNSDILEGVPLGNLELDPEAEAAIVAFLKTLTDGYMRPGGCDD
ncbi:MAG: cytochrome-c peroxidase [Planctomycetota bacterium]|jgi:cytochrome c peroxidase